MKAFLPAVLLLVFACSLTGRIFTSSDGVRKMDASIISYDEESEMVKIRRKDGRIFESAISLFSGVDQTFILRWNQGAKESYFIYGKEYPNHLHLLIEMLNSGGIGYGQTVIYGPGHPPIVIGNGNTPFLAWVNGYDLLASRYNRFNTTGVTFDLIKDKWRAHIAFRAGRSITTGLGGVVVGGPSWVGLPSVSGPILYQQSPRIVINGTPSPYSPVIVLPRGPSPVYVNPFRGGVMMNGVGMGGGGFVGSSRGFSTGRGISVRINR